MTNRQWLETLTNKQLADFFTFGVMVRRLDYDTGAFIMSIHNIARQYTSSTLGIELWLSATQEYMLMKDGEADA